MPTIALVDDDRNILDLRVHDPGDGRLPGADLQRRQSSAGRAGTESARSRDSRYQDAPDGDGMELLRKLRQSSDLPVIFLTSKDDEIDELFGLKMGADDFIEKPFSQRLLVERVRAVLRRAQPRDGS